MRSEKLGPSEVMTTWVCDCNKKGEVQECAVISLSQWAADGSPVCGKCDQGMTIKSASYDDSETRACADCGKHFTPDDGDYLCVDCNMARQDADTKSA